MKISVNIPTRNRPLLLMSVLTAFDQLSSGQHEIMYNVGVDAEDGASYEAATMMQGKMPLSVTIVPNDVLTIGGIWNHLAHGKRYGGENNLVLWEPDIYLAHVDDAIPLARYWDEQIVRYMGQHKALSWSDVELGDQAGYPIVSKDWLEAVGHLCVEHFPFWFCDTWFEELYQFTFNRKILIPPNLGVAGKRGETNNLRDLDFWWGFFNATRRIRLVKAFELSKRFGVQVCANYQEFLVSRHRWINAATKRDGDFRKLIPELETARRDMRDPTEKYIQAKANAEAYMNARGMDVWACLPKDIEAPAEVPLAAE